MKLSREKWHDTCNIRASSIFYPDTGLVSTITQTNVKTVPSDIYGVYNKTWSTYWISVHTFYIVSGQG